MARKILISQPKPTSDKSPYYDIANDFGVELVFRPFIKVEGLTSLEFRQQKVSILNYTAVVFTSRHAIDNFFKIARELRLQIPETMKYFCVTEQIALYIQKYVQYRKRKIFFGTTGKMADIVPLMVKHKQERYLIPLSDVHDNSVADMLTAKMLNHKECIMYRTVSNPFTEQEAAAFDYDVCVFFSPSGVNAFKETFADRYDSIGVATFGPATARAAHEAGLHVVVEAPTEQYPSMTSALRHYIEELSVES